MSMHHHDHDKDHQHQQPMQKRKLHLTTNSMLLALVVISVALFVVQHRMLVQPGPSTPLPKPTLRLKSKLAERQRKRRELDKHKELNVHDDDEQMEKTMSERAAKVANDVDSFDQLPKQGHENAPNIKYHIVFSTSCHEQQHWESMVFFYHAYKVQQPGTVTRIVSGCNSKGQAEQQSFFQKSIQPMRQNGFFIHFTPNYADLQKAKGGSYKYMNKPFGLLHWMEHGELEMVNNKTTTAKYEDDIVILMDPDMVLLQPIKHDFSQVENYIWEEKDGPPLSRRIVKHGHPMAQQDGYLGNQWMDLNVSHIFQGANIAMPKPRDGPVHWNAGPPYLATVRDMYQMAQKWTEYAPRVVQVHPELFAEMYGLIFAAIDLQLPFTLIRSLTVSTTETGVHREGWPFVDALEEHQVCNLPKDNLKLPITLHYCKRYLYGPMFFSKYRLKKNIMDCNKPLLQPPPASFVGQYNYSMFPPRADRSDAKTYQGVRNPIKSRRTAQREAFMLCGLIDAVNEALEHHKNLSCSQGTANLEKTYTVYSDPTDY